MPGAEWSDPDLLRLGAIGSDPTLPLDRTFPALYSPASAPCPAAGQKTKHQNGAKPEPVTGMAGR